MAERVEKGTVEKKKKRIIIGKEADEEDTKLRKGKGKVPKGVPQGKRRRTTRRQNRVTCVQDTASYEELSGWLDEVGQGENSGEPRDIEYPGASEELAKALSDKALGDQWEAEWTRKPGKKEKVEIIVEKEEKKGYETGDPQVILEDVEEGEEEAEVREEIEEPQDKGNDLEESTADIITSGWNLEEVIGGKLGARLSRVQRPPDILSRKVNINVVAGETVTERVTRENKEAEEENLLKRQGRLDQCWDAEGKPTKFGYTLAQALAYLKAIYHKNPDKPQRAKGFKTSITTTDDIPVRAGARKYNDIQKAFMTHKTRRLIKEGKAEQAKGAYASALVLVPYHDRIEAFMKRWGDKAQAAMWDVANEDEVATFYRMTIDLRAINSKTVADLFPLPRIDDLMDQVKEGTEYFSVGDIQDAFWNIELDVSCRHIFGYRTHNAFLQPTAMTQGGKNSANEWARCVAETFESIPQDEALVYQDDVLNHSITYAQHYASQEKIYDCLIERQLTFKRSKMHLNQDKIVFLGHMVDSTGRYPSPKAVEAITKQAYPKADQTAVRSFIGQTLYYRHYIEGYADKVGPLHALTRKGVDVPKTWGKEHEEAVDQLKDDLTSLPCLIPIDNTKPFEVRVDACRRGHGLGAILLQPDEEGLMRPVAYWSKALSKTEKDYSPTELECKGLHDCLLHWDIYLQCARAFDVYTDHQCLLYMVLGQTASNNGRLMRYRLITQSHSRFE